MFLKGESIIIDAPRRSGKTFLLEHIIKENPHKKIAVFTLNYNMFVALFSEYKNCFYGDRSSQEADLVIGDEVLVGGDYQRRGKQTICVGTYNRKMITWINPYSKKKLEEIKKFKKEVRAEIYRAEFGNYLK